MFIPNLQAQELDNLQEVYMQTKTITESLTSEGYPSDWTESTVQRIGITNGDKIINWNGRAANSGGRSIHLSSLKKEISGNITSVSESYSLSTSSNSYKWEIIATQEGAGNSNKVLNYNSIDTYPLSETSFYRLRQTDFDGTVAYSDVRSITINTSLNDKIVAFPNPAKSKITLKSENINYNEVRITSMLGEDLSPNMILLNNDEQDAIELNISDLKPYSVLKWNRTCRKSRLKKRLT